MLCRVFHRSVPVQDKDFMYSAETSAIQAAALITVLSRSDEEYLSSSLGASKLSRPLKVLACVKLSFPMYDGEYVDLSGLHFQDRPACDRHFWLDVPMLRGLTSFQSQACVVCDTLAEIRCEVYALATRGSLQ